ncbi:MAG TPA: gliding motility-associated C-terminal domain-containing protein [Bacteroidia bacterium]|jgi:gliding motility-associated-like protein|nr:gliding motility-associated C-terminal domain-containing protein [Bacteroidia bacterium]
MYLCCRTIRLFLVGAFFILSSFAIAQNDLPHPTANMENIPAGSYVIPMDNDHQAVVPAGQAPFNLKAYGLVNKFLQNGIPVKWAIKSGKALDGIDFSAMAEQITPTSSPAAMLDFRGGPFIVPDTTLPCGVSSIQLITEWGDNVSAYKLTQSVMVDIQHTITHRPKIAVFNNGGNELLQTKILDAAGIGNYRIIDAVDIAEISYCYTFASEAHATPTQVTTAVADAVKTFVMNGGNFLAQCDAIESYETKSLFHTTNDLFVANTKNINNTYPNPDMAISQIHGLIQSNPGGSVSNWTLANGSSWKSYYFPVVEGASDQIVIGAAHLIDANSPGGNVYYLGGHDYGRAMTGNPGPATNEVDLTDIERINGIRVYLNAVFVPSGTKKVAWVTVGAPVVDVACGDSIMLGCHQKSAAGSTYLWEPATGLSCPTCANPMASPGTTTTYTLVVTNGCVVNDQVKVNVTSPAPAQYSNTAACVGSATKFTDETANANYWKWDFGDPASSDNSSLLQNPTHTFSKAGSFQVSLIAGVYPQCLDSVTQTVTVDSASIIIVKGDSICSGTSTTLVASGANTYFWAPATGLSTTNGPSVIANPTQTTTYTITSANANGCVSTATATVTVNKTPVISVPGATICQGSTAILTASGANTYSWSPFQTLTDSVGATVNSTPTTTTTYTVTGTDANTDCKSNTMVTVKVNAVPVVMVDSASICTGETINLKATGAYTYVWSPNKDINTTTEAEVNVHPSVTTTYTIIGTDKNGCKDTTTTVLRVNPNPVITVTAAQICPGDTAILTATGANSYVWSPDYRLSSTTSNPVSSYTQVSTNYIVKGTNTFGCSSTGSAKVIVFPKPQAIIEANPNPASIYDPTIRFTSHSSGAITWQWYFGDPINSESTKENNTFIYPKEMATYPVMLIVTNQYGCIDTTTLDVSIKDEFSIFVPNTFTPNNDDVNDVFFASGHGIDETQYHMWIFDRWGNMIWKSNTWGETWDGKANGGGKLALIDTYVWKIEVKEKYTPTVHQLVGHVNIVK